MGALSRRAALATLLGGLPAVALAGRVGAPAPAQITLRLMPESGEGGVTVEVGSDRLLLTARDGTQSDRPYGEVEQALVAAFLAEEQPWLTAFGQFAPRGDLMFLDWSLDDAARSIRVQRLFRAQDMGPALRRLLTALFGPDGLPQP